MSCKFKTERVKGGIAAIHGRRIRSTGVRRGAEPEAELREEGLHAQCIHNMHICTHNAYSASAPIQPKMGPPSFML